MLDEINQTSEYFFLKLPLQISDFSSPNSFQVNKVFGKAPRNTRAGISNLAVVLQAVPILANKSQTPHSPTTLLTPTQLSVICLDQTWFQNSLWGWSETLL